MQRNNQSRSAEIKPVQTLKHLAFFGLGCLSWLGFSYLFALYVKIPQGRSIYDFPWHWDAPLWAFGFSFLGALFIILAKRFFGLLTEKSQSILRDFIILICFIPINSLVINAFSILILHATYSGREKPVEFDWIMGFLHNFISQTFVAMTCIGYFYLNLVNQTKERLSAARQAKTAMELKTLQQNIEPHFLFNNLNVLSSLIESNPKRANEFLEKLSELYRYILQTQTLETVALKDEFEFARNYAYLLQERFGNAYYFDWEIDENKLNGQKIIPVSIQILIENAVKHNAGSSQNPLRITINLNKNFLSVENEKREKPQTRPTNQTGLQNLQTRYAFLTERKVEINNEEKSFSVKLPLL
ncbi:MAG TPA: histidine kinase [Pyrinomonadaceae bacterium]|nr:histidine kinase [Pyrinomonadaceae bacterium]